MKPSYPHNRVWRPAHPNNYSFLKNKPERIVIHVVQGSWASALNWFQNPSARVSAHWTVASDGSVGQSVGDLSAAWHAGNWWWNSHSLGIEHGGYVDQPRYFTDAMLHASARLVAYKCKQYGIPVDRKHIVAHSQLPGTTHTDPGAHWPWARYMRLVKQYRFGSGGSAKPAPSQPASKPKPKKADYARINFLGYGNKDREIVYAGRAALNAIARDRDMKEMFAYGTTDPSEIAYISGRSAIAKKGQVVSVVCGAPAKRYLAPEVRVIGTLDETDVLDGIGDDYEHSKRLVSWRLDAIAQMLGFGQSEQDKVQRIYSEAVGLSAGKA